ncbi:hypothetical protein L6452_00864 [Arctium lappa]|uniref:Uncharacterized protein n=1 Tax=Arctium lappa TaxID=4217 RepID=A0ACB9FGD0_ARCLA|nr:hypothetical protein L6452_00864 [Arctium lappa]
MVWIWSLASIYYQEINLHLPLLSAAATCLCYLPSFSSRSLPLVDPCRHAVTCRCYLPLVDRCRRYLPLLFNPTLICRRISSLVDSCYLPLL